MKSKLSEDLINISTMMMVAKERRDMVRLAGELSAIIEKAMEIEKAEIHTSLTQDKSTLSASIKFTKKEIETMSKTFKKEFIANGLVAHLIKRPSGKSGCYYEIRYRRNGYNITVSNKDLATAKKLFVEATNNLTDKTTSVHGKLKFGSIADQWLQYKKGKVIQRTWNRYAQLSRDYLNDQLRNQPIKEMNATDLDALMNTFSEDPRKYEDMRTVLNSIFEYAKISGIISHNPVKLIPFKRAERTSRAALNERQIITFFERLQAPKYDSVRQGAFVLYFFGLRPCELDNETHVENGFLVCRNRKRKNGKIEYKKIPIPDQAWEFIDFSKPLVFPFKYVKAAELLNEVLIDRLTPYCLRHTFASTCAANKVQIEIVNIWMGDSPHRLVEKVYIHYSDKLMQSEMKKVKFVTSKSLIQ